MEAHERAVREQIDYYRARAGEYDEWFLRQGRYDHGPELNAVWWLEVQRARAALDAFAPVGRVLELACGTGLWTGELLTHAEHVTAVDAGPEVLAIHASRYPERVARVQADIFAFEPEERFDVVFFSFWLSHVPPERFAAFWDLVGRCLVPGGRAFFVDSLREETSTASNHRLPDEGSAIQVRILNDGRRYQIVKVYHEPASLAAAVAELGWTSDIHATGRYFVYGEARPPRR